MLYKKKIGLLMELSEFTFYPDWTFLKFESQNM